MQNRFRPLLKAVPLLLAAACAQVPGTASDPAESDVAKRPQAPLAADVAKGQTPRHLALPVAASDAESAALLAKNPGVQAFLANEGKGWKAVFDRRSGQPMYFEGPGIAWMPGRGNSLTVQDTLGGNFLTLGPATKAKTLAVRADSMARALLSRNAGLAGVDGAALVRDDEWTGAVDEDATLYFATFRHAPAGTKQQDARLTFVVSNGNLVQIHAEKLQPAVDGAAKLTPDEAWNRLRKQARISEEPEGLVTDLAQVALTVSDEPAGVYTGKVGAGYRNHLAYTLRFRLPGDFRTLAGLVDAKTGELLDLWDDNRYGTVQGGIWKRTLTEPSETVVPFENISVGTNTTDLGGNFPGTGSASTALGGKYFKVTDSCGAPNATTTNGVINLGTSTGSDCNFSSAGHSTRAARNADYHLNHVQQMGKKWLGGTNAKADTWFASNVGVNVNLNQTCNAYWDGSTVNFFRSDSTCANTGEIADVMQHEWGHGLDSNTKSGSVGDSAKGEAFSDTVALLFSHDNCVGPGFFKTAGNGETTQCDSAVRDFKYLVTKDNIASKCPNNYSCKGALGYECHCESHLLSGATWDLSQAFVARYGQEEGWHQFEKVWLRAAPLITAYLANTAGNAYSALLAADDDNGNTTDGTPNADLINAAFAAHGLANTTQPPVKVVACPSRPAAPTLTATGGAGKVDLSWTAVSGATAYNVYRHLDGHAAAFLPVGAATGTTFSDVQVGAGFAYAYVISATVGACTSPLGAPVIATAGGGTPPPANDFSLAVSPASLTVQQGTSGTVTVTTAVTSGSAQSVALTLSGLPAGVTGSFNPATVTAGASATLTLTVAASAVAATSALTVTGTAASGAKTASVSLTVSATPPANAFSISASPASLSVQQGASGTVTVATAVTSGAAQSIALTLSGLPAGVTGTFNPSTVTAGGSSTLTLAAGTSAAAATSALTITGTAASGAKTAAVSLTVTAGTPPPAGALANGDFESGLASWTATGKTAPSTSGANTGTGLAVVGSSSPYNGDSTLAQAFVVPAAGISTLTFVYKPHNPGADTLTYASQRAELRSASGTALVTFFRAVANDNVWKSVSQDLSAYAGQTLTLWFAAHDDGYATDPVWFEVDSVKVTTTAPDTTAPVATVTAPAAGATVSGTVAASATATDNVGVTKLELFVDGASIGSAAAASLSVQWDTTKVADGSHTVTAKASDSAGNVGTSAAVTVTVKNATTPPPTSDVIKNGTFETGITSWTVAGTTTPIASAVLAHSGSRSGRMGWMTGTSVAAGDSYIYQWVTIPASATKATLTFWYYAFSEDFVSYDWQDALLYAADGKTILKNIFHQASNAQTWKQVTVDVTAYKGQTVAPLFSVHSDGDSLRTAMWVDDVSLVVQ